MLYYVFVDVPMAPALVFNGQMFVWSAINQHYQLYDIPVVKEAPKETKGADATPKF